MTNSSPGAAFAATVLVSAQARDALKAAAKASFELERGGILIGYRDAHGITVDDIIEVPDCTAARTRYLRRENTARRVLSAYLDRPGLDASLGYVGEWHTHPAPVPPSPTDHDAMRTMSRRNRQQVALIVAALQGDGREPRLYALISNSGQVRSRIAGRFGPAAIEAG